MKSYDTKDCIKSIGKRCKIKNFKIKMISKMLVF